MVRWFKDKTGRFQERPHYEPAELDNECERIVTQFLVGVHGRLDFPITTDDLTNLVETMASDLDLYADLTDDGDDVEGVTRFARSKQPAVAIAKALSEDQRRENRLRTTLTHELGHVRFHDGLFQAKLAAQDLFSRADPAKVICKRDRMVDAPVVDWMEWQACYASGSFLMPKSVLTGLVTDWRRETGVQATLAPDDQHGSDLIDRVRQRFGTSAEAARIRLVKLGLVSNGPKIPTLFD